MDISALDAALDEESEVEIDAFTRGKGKASVTRSVEQASAHSE